MRVSGWFRDAVGGKRDHLGVHNSGNVVVVRDQSETVKDEQAEKEWILVRKKKFENIYILYYYCLCQMLV